MKSKLDESKFYFIAIKVVGVDERNVSSNRAKYVVATYIGANVGTFMRAGGSTTKVRF